VIGRRRRGKQHSLMFYPYGGQGAGQPLPPRFCDDIVTREMAYSPEQTQRLHGQAWRWTSRPAPTHRIRLPIGREG
jgi:hypothetical protein